MSIGVLIIRLTHTGVYADGRPNTASVTIYDLDQDILKMNRARSVPIPPNTTVDIAMSSETFISYNRGTIRGLVSQGLLRSELILQFRDRDHEGGPAGTGQTLRAGVLNVERVGNVLRLVIPDNIIPTNVDSSGYLVGEPLRIVGLTGAFRALNGSYTVSNVAPGSGLAGAAVGSYLVEVPSVGGNIAAAIHAAGVALQLVDGRITVEFTSDGDLGGLGANVFGYIAGQVFPGTGGGSVLSVEDEGILVDAATSTLNFVGAGVTAATGGAGIVTVTVPGGGGTLAAVLAGGNTTGGSNLIVSTGDSFVGATDLVLSPGAGVGDNIILDGLTWPSADGVAGTALVTDGLGVLSFAAPAPAVHAATHIRSGTDPVDGDLLDVDYVPTNYTRTLIAPTTSLEELTSHLRGIDLALGAASGAATAVMLWGTISVASTTTTRFLTAVGDPGLAPLVPVSWASPRGGTLRNLRIRHNNPTGNGNAIVYTILVNGVASTLTVSIASTAANGSDLVNSVVIVAGDLLDVRVTKALAIADGTVSVMVSVEMAA